MIKRLLHSLSLALLVVALSTSLIATPVLAVWVPGGNERYCACYCGWWSVFMCHLGGLPPCTPGPYPQCDLDQ